METKKIIGMSLLVAGFGALVYYFINKGREIGLSDKQTRLLTFSTSYCTAGLSGTVMIDLPAVSESYYQDHEIALNKTKLDQIKQQYGTFVKAISEMTNIPDTLIYSFIFIESGGDFGAINGKATGLMQVGWNSATDIVFMEHKKGRLGEAEKAVLSKYLGGKLGQILAMKSPGLALYIAQGDLLNPELNILVGSIYLGQLIDESMDNGSLRLDKVIARYNSGYYSYSRGKDLIGDTLAVIARVNPITKAYITKMIGKNGVLEILESQNCG